MFIYSYILFNITIKETGIGYTYKPFSFFWGAASEGNGPTQSSSLSLSPCSLFLLDIITENREIKKLT